MVRFDTEVLVMVSICSYECRSLLLFIGALYAFSFPSFLEYAPYSRSYQVASIANVIVLRETQHLLVST
jgi:hypothetical protein